MNTATETKTSALAVVAIVTSIFCFPIGVVLAIVALIRISGANGKLGGKGIAIAALIISLLWIPVTGVAAAIMIPSFVRFQCAAKQSEAKIVLSSLSVAEEAYRAEHNTYAPLDQLDFSGGLGGSYEFTVVESSAGAFEARATGKGDMSGDVWSIRNERRPTAITDKCR